MKSRYQTKPTAYTADATIDIADIIRYGHLVINQTGITLTVPTPGRNLLDFTFKVTNNAAGAATLAGTNMFPAGGDSISIASGETVLLTDKEPVKGTYVWIVERAGSSGAMSFGSEPVAVSSSTSGTAGDAATASRSNHGHDLSAHIHDATHGGQLTHAVAFSDYAAPDALWDPSASFAWATANATVSAQVSRFGVSGTKVSGLIDLTISDGGGATGFTCPCPAGYEPPDLDAHIPCTLRVTVGGTPDYQCSAYIDATQAVAANRVITVDGIVLTDDTAARLSIGFEYERAMS